LYAKHETIGNNLNFSNINSACFTSWICCRKWRMSSLNMQRKLKSFVRLYRDFSSYKTGVS